MPNEYDTRSTLAFLQRCLRGDHTPADCDRARNEGWWQEDEALSQAALRLLGAEIPAQRDSSSSYWLITEPRGTSRRIDVTDPACPEAALIADHEGDPALAEWRDGTDRESFDDWLRDMGYEVQLVHE